MANIGTLSICSLLLSALALPNALAAEYTLMPSPQTVHVGHFSAQACADHQFRRHRHRRDRERSRSRGS